uniref:Palmitoyltransferase n=1 Tax=Timspurckia oligopyrenoides TaxID=708627 RepID=A0A7S0ZBH6_9RHOD|mmetsp:Transcript_11246/g.20324  ORF Transcript_11246/g.20324 Transcript_11246/m.20324 type:complete len:326 (+) Transcript_11246:166-1143(+)
MTIKSGHFDESKIKGNSKLWFHGKLLTGPDYYNAIGSFFAIILPTGIYYGICIGWLCTFWSPGGFILLAFAIPLTLTSLISFFLASTDDPGIIPRNDESPVEFVNNPGHPRELEAEFNGCKVRIKYCETCKHWRPLRCVHCFKCNNCVERFDHHCPWLGNCVGRRNYRAFFFFVSVTSILLIFVIATCILQLSLNTKRFLDLNQEMISTAEAFSEALAFWGSGVLIAVIVYAFLAFGFTAGLTGFHLFLMWKNLSTNEFIKKTYGKKNEMNPFPDRGVNAWRSRLLTSKTQSKVKIGYNGPKLDDDENMNDLIQRARAQFESTQV